MNTTTQPRPTVSEQIADNPSGIDLLRDLHVAATIEMAHDTTFLSAVDMAIDALVDAYEHGLDDTFYNRFSSSSKPLVETALFNLAARALFNSTVYRNAIGDPATSLV